MDPSPVAPALDQVIWSLSVVRYAQVSATLVALYDHLVTLDQEVELRKQMSLSKILFVLNRYFGEAVLVLQLYIWMTQNHSFQTCSHLFQTQAWGSVVAVWLAQGIMALRMYALYQRSVYILALICVAWVCEAVSMASIIGLGFSRIDVKPETISGILPICTLTSIPSFFFLLWFPLIGFETILLGLASFVTYQHVMDIRKIDITFSASSIMTVILRDSLIYFLVVLATYLTNAITWVKLPVIWLEIPQTYCLALTCILASRLVLNLRDAYDEPLRETTVVTSTIKWRTRRTSIAPSIGRFPSCRTVVVGGSCWLEDTRWHYGSALSPETCRGDRMGLGRYNGETHHGGIQEGSESQL